jgi:hypothetical protein
MYIFWNIIFFLSYSDPRERYHFETNNMIHKQRYNFLFNKVISFLKKSVVPYHLWKGCVDCCKCFKIIENPYSYIYIQDKYESLFKITRYLVRTCSGFIFLNRTVHLSTYTTCMPCGARMNSPSHFQGLLDNIEMLKKTHALQDLLI